MSGVGQVHFPKAPDRREFEPITTRSDLGHFWGSAVIGLGNCRRVAHVPGRLEDFSPYISQVPHRWGESSQSDFPTFKSSVAKVADNL